MLNQLISMAMQGMLQNRPEMKQFNQFFGGKSPNEQIQTLVNMAQEKGMNVNEKMFSAQELRNMGFNIPQ